jgi:hypothetical protein
MRLTAEQVNAIRRIASEEAGAESVVRLFGSRLDDTARGGDIDLLLEVTYPVDNPALFTARIAADAPLRGNPKGRGDSGLMAALLAPHVEQPHRVARALPWARNRPVAHVA